MKKAIALLSGGFDSVLAVKIMQKQGFEVEGLNIITPFCDTSEAACEAAAELGISCHCQRTDEAYMNIVRHPRYGYGKGVNPCLDCHLYMIRRAKERLEATGADIVITGEVLGQRPMSQQRHHLEMLEYHCGLGGRLLRPICALQLPPTEAEKSGLVDRTQLYGLTGRGRTPLHTLGKELGLTSFKRAMPGCCLTEKSFAPRVRDLLRHETEGHESEIWEYEILRWGRHIRFDSTARCVLGRRESDCDHLHEAVVKNAKTRQDVVYWEPESFMGPSVLLIGRVDEQTLRFALDVQISYSKNASSESNLFHKYYLGAESIEPFVPTPGFTNETLRTL